VIIPALNEEQAIRLVLRDIPRNVVDEVIVVDNGSTDGTARAAASLGATVRSEPKKGYGAACLAGMEALGADIEIVVFLDGDYSDYPEELEALLRPIVENLADFVIGSRMLRKEARKALSWQQRWGNRLATRLVDWRFEYRFTDLGPFRAMRRNALDSLHMRDRGFGWTVEMQVKAACAGLRALEVPVRYRSRIGRSKISGTLWGSLRAGAKILYTIGKYALHYEPCPSGMASTSATEG
jgi:glycosyltransferase involved in cell wall biosynthesis